MSLRQQKTIEMVVIPADWKGTLAEFIRDRMGIDPASVECIHTVWCHAEKFVCDMPTYRPANVSTVTRA